MVQFRYYLLTGLKKENIHNTTGWEKGNIRNFRYVTLTYFVLYNI